MRILQQHKTGTQEGSLLVIALIVLGVIALSTIYLSLVLLNEIRSTRYADNGVIAHYTAESGAERALWRVKLSKANENPNLFVALDGVTGACAAEDDGVGLCEDPERTYNFTKAVISATDFTAYDVPQNVPAFTDVYNPLQETGSINTGVSQINVDWYVTTCSGSAKLETTYTPILYVGGVLQSQTPVTRINVCGCGTQSELGYACSPTFSIPGLSTSSFYRVAFRSLDTSIKKLVMTASNAGSPVSIPSQVEIKTSGTYREARASVTARSLWKDVVSGLFNYVIFSEESLIKDTLTSSSYPYASRCGFCSDSTPAVPKPCSSNADCTSPDTCSVANTASDTIDVAGSQAFCSDMAGTETYPTPTGDIAQTNESICNVSCNGYTYCGDGFWQSPNGVGDGFGSGAEECDFGPANSDTVPLSCRKDCREPRCGDLVVDNGTFVNKDGGSETRSETCDQDNTSNSDACYAPGHAQECTLTVCGDGITQAPNGAGFDESCDGSPNATCPDGCTVSCTCAAP